MSAPAVSPDRSAIAAAEARFRDGAIADAAALLAPLAAAASPIPTRSASSGSANSVSAGHGKASTC